MKFLSTLLLLFVVCVHSCSSQDTSTRTPLTRTEISKQRSNSLARAVPKPLGFINDFARLFSEKENKSLDSIVTAFEKQTTIEIGVATVDSAMVSDRDFEDYSLVMLRTWGVGKKEKNNGILVVIAPSLRRIRIQNGFGIEKILSNTETQLIIDNDMTPGFKQGKYFEGTRDGIISIINALKQKGI